MNLFFGIAQQKSDLDITYDFSNDIQTLQDTLDTLEKYQRVDILPVAGGRAACPIDVPFSYSVNTSGTTTASAVYYGVSTNPSVEPSSWTLRDLRENGASRSGIGSVTVAADEYLFFKILISISLGDGGTADAIITLTDNTTTPYICIDDTLVNTMVASGSPLSWSESIVE